MRSGIGNDARDPVFVRTVDGNGNDSGGGGSSSLGTGTNWGGTITTGGSAQSLAPAKPTRRLLRGQNLSTGDLWVNELGQTAAASQPSFRVPAGGTFSVSTNQAVSVFGATTGQAFSATEV